MSTAQHTGPRIEILVDKKGNPTVSAPGVGGGDCKIKSAGYESLFGDVIETQATSEAFEDEPEIEIKMEQDNS
jgi:hypothetical protein